MAASNYFQKTIKAYLDKRAESDTLFTKAYANENKSIEECCNYIASQAKASNCNALSDEEVYGLAMHYYDTADLKVSSVDGYKVIVNKEIELTEEEKATAKEQAIKDYQHQILLEMQKKSSGSTKKNATTANHNEMQSLF